MGAKFGPKLRKEKNISSSGSICPSNACQSRSNVSPSKPVCPSKPVRKPVCKSGISVL